MSRRTGAKSHLSKEKKEKKKKKRQIKETSLFTVIVCAVDDTTIRLVVACKKKAVIGTGWVAGEGGGSSRSRRAIRIEGVSGHGQKRELLGWGGK